MAPLVQCATALALLLAHLGLFAAHREHKVCCSVVPLFRWFVGLTLPPWPRARDARRRRRTNKHTDTIDCIGICSRTWLQVHNIVLYPDKESWCKTTPIKQVVTWPSCAPQELDNNVCVGACFSYMVPHSEPSAPGDLIRPYCDSCQPLDSVWHTVGPQLPIIIYTYLPTNITDVMCLRHPAHRSPSSASTRRAT